jgi:hypothetical protein
MKINILLSFMSLFLLVIFSCRHEENLKGTVTFGANYDVINCITNVVIFIDGKQIGKLNSPSHGITECGQPENLTEELMVGPHSYKIEIRPALGIGCTKDINGTVDIIENECTKVFIDYYSINF